jgi:large-conductance mechanosensitive channel
MCIFDSYIYCILSIIIILLSIFLLINAIIKYRKLKKENEKIKRRIDKLFLSSIIKKKAHES